MTAGTTPENGQTEQKLGSRRRRVLNGPRPYSRTGLNALKARIKLRGLEAIDRRTATARLLIQWRNALMTDLGGEDSLSAQQKAIVDMAVKTRLFIATVDAFLMEQPSIVNRQKRCVLPVVRERTQLADALTRYLMALGLERKAKDVPTLHGLLRAAADAGDGASRS